MKKLKSTGNVAEDAKLLSEALGLNNQESFEEAKKRSDLSNSGTASGNDLVATLHREGETLAVIRDGTEDNEPKQETPVAVITKPVNEGLKFRNEKEETKEK